MKQETSRVQASMSLTEASREQLNAARKSAHGRSSVAAVGGESRLLRQIVMAFVAGSGLSEHRAPGDATLQVLSGRVRLAVGSDHCEGKAGDLLPIPVERHVLEALEDSVVLLTIALRPPRSDG